MDPKYEFRYTANANNAARAGSLVGRGTLNIMQSHWMVQTIPGLFAAQLATAAPAAPLQVDYLAASHNIDICASERTALRA